MIVLGLSSGTSMDGIDVAAAEIRVDGESLVLDPLGHAEHAYSEQLRAELAAALPPAHTGVEALCRIDTGVGQEFAAAATAANARLAGGRAELVVSHGQTLYHWVEQSAVRGTMQLGQPAWIAEATGLPVVSDIRARDVSAGGQGAPLAAILDTYLLRGQRTPAAALNLGGIANVTVVRDDQPPLAFDTGPANALLDAAVARVTRGAEHADVDGLRAARGVVDEALLSALLDEPYYGRHPPKSTGKELFHSGYLDDVLTRVPEVSDADMMATLTELTAITVAEAVAPYALRRIVVSGGGARNPVLMDRIAARVAPARLVRVEDLGMDGAAKEAYLFALIGFLTWHGLPATLPSCTGARRAPIVGSVTPGLEPLRPPDPLRTSPTSLRVRASGTRVP